MNKFCLQNLQESQMLCLAGDVKEFGFREIPDDNNYHSSFSAHVPQAEPDDAGEGIPSKSSTGHAKGTKDTDTENSSQSQSWFSGTSTKASSWMPWSKKEEVVGLCRFPINILLCARNNGF